MCFKLDFASANLSLTFTANRQPTEPDTAFPVCRKSAVATSQGCRVLAPESERTGKEPFSGLSCGFSMSAAGAIPLRLEAIKSETIPSFARPAVGYSACKAWIRH